MKDSPEQHIQHILDSGASYVGGGVLIFGVPLADIADTAQAIGVILGVFVIGVKLVYDLLKLRRDFFKKKEK
jgi:hypothetical protein